MVFIGAGSAVYGPCTTDGKRSHPVCYSTGGNMGTGPGPPPPHPHLGVTKPRLRDVLAGPYSAVPPPPPLPIFEADGQNFASAPLVPRGFKLQNFRPATPFSSLPWRCFLKKEEPSKNSIVLGAALPAPVWEGRRGARGGVAMPIPRAKRGRKIRSATAAPFEGGVGGLETGLENPPPPQQVNFPLTLRWSDRMLLRAELRGIKSEFPVHRLQKRFGLFLAHKLQANMVGPFLVHKFLRACLPHRTCRWRRVSRLWTPQRPT